MWREIVVDLMKKFEDCLLKKQPNYQRKYMDYNPNHYNENGVLKPFDELKKLDAEIANSFSKAIEQKAVAISETRPGPDGAAD